ncbi:MAG: ATP-dependent DNA ligase [Chloroflexota bacterium]|nr:ATP-dependent DNA ligase [Chloroflexota bacterium]
MDSIKGVAATGGLLFGTLAAVFERLEHTSSRKQLISLLADLLRQVEPEAIAQVTYLLQGRVAPLYEPVEFGLGERSIERAVAEAYGVDPSQVRQHYARVGDLGLVVTELARDSTDGADRSVLDVFAELGRVADISGAGSGERKLAALRGLLAGLDPISAKHLVRIPLGNNRLGVGDATILAAFNEARLGGAKAEQVSLEEAYNRTSDLGLLGRTLWTAGLEGVRKLQVTVGRPIRPQLAERLPDVPSLLEKLGGRAHAQLKFDGIRVQLHLDRSQAEGHQVRLFSRSLEDMTAMFPELVQGVVQQVQASSAILDSEALAFNPLSEEFLPFQETTRRRRKHGIGDLAAELPLKAMVFDVMYRDGQALLDRPLLARIDVLQAIVSGTDVLLPERGVVVDRPEQLDALFESALERSLEGLVVKRVDSPYQAGARNFNWVKLKRHSRGALEDTIDCVLLGYFVGRGKRVGLGVGALLVGVYDARADEFKTVTKIGTGLSDDQWREVAERAAPYRSEQRPARVQSRIVPSVWLEPKIVVEVLADEITSSPNHTAGYALRFPRVIRFREADKRPEDATTLAELVELYHAQRGRAPGSEAELSA